MIDKVAEVELALDGIQVTKELVKIIYNVTGIEVSDLKQSLYDSLDELDKIEIFMGVEETFHLDLPIDEEEFFEKHSTVGEFIEYCAKEIIKRRR